MTGQPKKLMMESVSRNTLSKQVIDSIVQLMVSGQLKAGDRLPPEMKLMEELEVSRPVLREALSSLETLGVITRKNREGTFLNSKVGSYPFSVMLALSHFNLRAIIEARMSLELGLVTMAAEKITDAQLEELKVTIDQIANSQDNDYGKYDKEFHRLIALSANNPVVEGMINSLLLTHEEIDSRIKYREKELTVKYHTAIYEALKNHDPHQAFTEMYQHLDYVRKKVLEE